MTKNCDSCGSTEFVGTKVGSSGLFGPDLLPGAGKLNHARFTLQICAKCGRVYWWVPGDDLEKVKKSPNFTQFDLGTQK